LLVHFDIWDPIATLSLHGHKYLLTIVEHTTRFTWLYPMKLKSETGFRVQSFVTLIQTQFHKIIKCIRTDNGPEFNLAQIFAAKEIIHHKSCVETPQQNGLVERKHQHILNITRSLLFHSSLPQCFWNYVAALAVHLINRIPSSLLDNKSPYYVLHDKLPDISHLRLFGCLAFTSTNTSHRKKLDSRARKCIFLRYKRGVKCFLLCDLHNRELFLSRHVHFYENIFPHKQS